MTKQEVVKGLKEIRFERCQPGTGGEARDKEFIALSAAITYLQQPPIGREELREQTEYCNCLGLRIHDRNDINCMRCGKLLQKKTYTCPNCGQYSMDRFELDKVKCNRCSWITDLYEAIKASEPEKTCCECPRPYAPGECVPVKSINPPICSKCGLEIEQRKLTKYTILIKQPEKTCLNCGNLGTCEPPCSKWQPQEVKVIESLDKLGVAWIASLKDKINDFTKRWSKTNDGF